jgi:hypothetical protein
MVQSISTLVFSGTYFARLRASFRVLKSLEKLENIGFPRTVLSEAV